MKLTIRLLIVCVAAATVLLVPFATRSALAAGTGQNGFVASDYVTNIPGTNLGPIGVAFDTAGNLYFADYGHIGELDKAPPGGGSFTTVGGSGLFGLAFAKDGGLYATSLGTGTVVEVDPTTGSVLRTIANIAGWGIAVDPLSGDLFVANACGGICRISNYQHGSVGPAVVSTYSTAFPDGISFGPDGTLYAAVEGAAIYRIAGTNTGTPGAVLSSTPVNGGSDGVAVGLGNNFVAANDNDGTVTKLDYTTAPPTQTIIVTGGTRGDFATVGPDGCLYATQSNGIEKVSNQDGTCSFTPVVTQDTTAPTCALKGTVPGGIQVKMQDSDGGLEATTGGTFTSAPSPAGGIQLTTDGNARVTIPAVAGGTKTEVDVTALKVNTSAASQVGFKVTDVGGNVVTCDPVLTSAIRSNGAPSVDSVPGIGQADHLVHVFNDGNGVENLTVTVNGQSFALHGLSSNQQATLEIGSALQSTNQVSVTTTGKPGGSVALLFGNI